MKTKLPAGAFDTFNKMPIMHMNITTLVPP